MLVCITLLTFAQVLNRLLLFLSAYLVALSTIHRIRKGLIMARAHTLTAASLFAVLLICQPLTAQAQQPSPWIFTANAIGAHQSEVDMTDTGGSFSVDRWFVNGGVTFAWSARTSLVHCTS